MIARNVSLTSMACCLMLAGGLTLVGCKSTPQDGNAAATAAPTEDDAPPSALAAKLQGPAPKDRPSDETIALAHREYRWDEWKQLPMALDLSKKQNAAWQELTAAWSQRKAAGENAPMLRTELLGNLPAEQQQYWVRYVLYRSAARHFQDDSLTAKQKAKLWAAAEKPASQLYADGVLNTNPYMRDIGEHVDQVAAAAE